MTTSRDLPTDIPGAGSHLPFDFRDDESELFSSASIGSTAGDLVEEHGRRYQNYRYGSSPFPRGDELAKRNELCLHNLMLFMYSNRLFLSKIENPRNVLDVKCGQFGLWAKNMADSYPDTQVAAMDVSVLDNEGRMNLEFLVQSLNDDWILDEVTNTHGLFDFIFVRHVFGASRDFPKFYKQCFDHLEPGGYFEQNEFTPAPSCDDGQYRKDSMILQMARLIPAMGDSYGTDYQLATIMRGMVKAAGFVDVQEKVVKMPWSPWATPGTDYHELGQLLKDFFQTGLQGWMLAPLVKYQGFTPEQVNTACEIVFDEQNRNDQHLYYRSVTITARKPAATPNLD